eukprot:g16825.t1
MSHALKRHLLRWPHPLKGQLRHCAFESPETARGRLSNARLRLVQRHNAVLSPISTSLGHAGYIIGLLEYGVTDIWWLRIWAVIVNLFQLHWVSLSVPEPSLSEEEAQLYQLLGDSVSVREFADLAGFGHWLMLQSGQRLAEEGVTFDREKAMLYLIAEGEVELTWLGYRSTAARYFLEGVVE